MTIPLIKEDPEMYDNMGVYERCHFCAQTTDLWHENTNNPVCKACSLKYKVSDLPDYGKVIRANKRKAAKKKLLDAWKASQEELIGINLDFYKKS